MALSVDDLQTAAQQAYASKWEGRASQKDLGDVLGIDRSAISRGLRSPGLKHAAVQARILSYLNECTVQRRSTYNGKNVRHEWVIDP
jgi:hypothetical protein